MNKLKNKIIGLFLTMLVFALTIGTGYSIFLFDQNKEVNIDTNIEKMDDVKDNYYFSDDTYHVIFFAQPPRNGDNFAFDENGFTGTYTPGDQSMGYWDRPNSDGTGKDRGFIEKTVQRSISSNIMDSLPDLYIDRPDDNNFPLIFTGWTMNRALMTNFVTNSESATGFQGVRDNDYDYFNILDPLENIDTMLENHTTATNPKDTTQKSIDGSRIGDHYILLYPIYTTGKAYNGANGEKKFVFRLKSEEQHTYNYNWNGDTDINTTADKYNYFFMQDWNTYSSNQDPDKYYYYYKNFRVKDGEKYYLDFDVPQFTYDNYGGDWFYIDYKNPNGNSSSYTNAPFISSSDDPNAYIVGSGYYNIYVHITWEYGGILGIGDHSKQYSDKFNEMNNENHVLIKNQDFQQNYSVLQGLAHVSAPFYITIKVEKVNDFKLLKASYSNNFENLDIAPSFSKAIADTDNTLNNSGGIYYQDYLMMNVPLRNKDIPVKLPLENDTDSDIWYNSNFFGIASIDYPLKKKTEGEANNTNFPIKNSTDKLTEESVNSINNYNVFKNENPPIQFDVNENYFKIMSTSDSSQTFQNKFNTNQFFAVDYTNLKNANTYVLTQTHLFLRLIYTPDTTTKQTNLTGAYLKIIPQKKPDKINLWFFSRADYTMNKNNAIDSNNLLDPSKLGNNFIKVSMTPGSKLNTLGPTLVQGSSIPNGITFDEFLNQYTIYDHLNENRAITIVNGQVFEKNMVFIYD